jgi:uncharacterized membrane protein YphA (DoxX/SURF4 family)
MTVANRTTPDYKLIRLSIALVWLYQGLWCKVLGRVPAHVAVISAVPFIGPAGGRVALLALGLVECGIALWVLSGQRMRLAAIVQTCLLIVMNTGGLIWALRLVPDPPGMILQNFAFLMLIWVATEEPHHAARA